MADTDAAKFQAIAAQFGYNTEQRLVDFRNTLRENSVRQDTRQGDMVQGYASPAQKLAMQAGAEAATTWRSMMAGPYGPYASAPQPTLKVPTLSGATALRAPTLSGASPTTSPYYTPPSPTTSPYYIPPSPAIATPTYTAPITRQTIAEPSMTLTYDKDT